MYEQFGAIVDQNDKTVTFRLFVPDNTLDPEQYRQRRLTRPTGVFVVGGFQNPLTRIWDPDDPVPMRPRPTTRIPIRPR
ncbi:MAG: hypothetical protein QM757_08210 [Paludibaculum sp.]